MKIWKIGDHNPLSFQVDYDRPNVFHLGDYDKETTLASKEEKAAQTHQRPSTSFFKDSCKRFVKNPVAMTCFVLMVLLILIIIFVPLFCPYGYSDTLYNMYQINGKNDTTFINLGPMQWSQTDLNNIAAGKFVFPHLFGTDTLGRDYFIRVIYGTRVSLVVGFFASVIVLIIGSLYGAISGFFGGKVDMIMMRIVDVIYSLPDIVLIILISVVLNNVFGDSMTGFLGSLGSGMISIFIVFALLYWVGMARLVRGQVLSLKEQEYVLSSRSIGASPWFIIRKHLLPNSMSVIIISAGLQIPSAIFTESFLSFLGLGVRSPMPSLGSLASDAESSLQIRPYVMFIPALIICLIVLCLNLIGDGLRDAFDPKLQR
jgi:oligopeptide transport system permease protein